MTFSPRANLPESDTSSVGATQPTDSISLRGPGGARILFGIEPNRLPPDLKRTGPYWELDHYEPKAGKIVGFSPGPGLPDWTTMRTKWGFSGILVGPGGYQDAINAGFSPNNLWVLIGAGGGGDWCDLRYTSSTIDNYPAQGYYWDEVFDHDCAQSSCWAWETFVDIAWEIHSRGKKFIMSGYKRCRHVASAGNQSFVDIVMFSSYRHWVPVPYTGEECWCGEWYCGGGQDDQRDDWTDMRDIFGSKFSHTWIGAHPPGGDHSGDGMDEIDNLCGHAANLGLSGIWLYCGNGVEAGKLESFCDSAWRWGFLRQFQRQFYIWWRCVDPGGCDPDYPDGWTIDYIEYTNQCREVFPSGPPGPGYCYYP